MGALALLLLFRSYRKSAEGLISEQREQGLSAGLGLVRPDVTIGVVETQQNPRCRLLSLCDRFRELSSKSTVEGMLERDSDR